MNKKVAKEILKELRDKYPNVKSIDIQYEGSGDSFNDFWDYDITWKEGTPDDSDSGDNLKEEVLKVFSDVIDILWDKVGADFNNDGSEGTFTVDLENLKINMDCYEKYSETRFSGESDYFKK